jgi:hypothetical protein
MRSTWSIGLVAIMLVAPPASFTPGAEQRAPTVGKLEGHVRDSTGLPMPSAQVWIDGTGFGGVADLRGHYFIDNIPARMVDLTVTHVGYRRVQLKGVRISEGNTIAQDFSLEPIGNVLDQIEQSESQVALSKEAASDTAATVVETREKMTVGRIATGLLTQLSGAVIDSARNALVGRLLGSTLKGLSGEVTTAAGIPIAGAKIEVDGASYVLTGADGRFLILPAIGRKLNLRVSAPGFRTLETPLDKLKGGEGRRLTLRLAQ